MDLTQKLLGVVMTKSFNVKPNDDSNESKHITLKVDFSDSELRDVLWVVMRPLVIKVQGWVRKHWTDYSDKQTVTIKFGEKAERGMSLDELKAKVKNAETDEEKKYWRGVLTEMIESLD